MSRQGFLDTSKGKQLFCAREGCGVVRGEVGKGGGGGMKVKVG